MASATLAIVQTLPSLAGTFGCFARIQEHLYINRVRVRKNARQAGDDALNLMPLDSDLMVGQLMDLGTHRAGNLKGSLASGIMVRIQRANFHHGDAEEAVLRNVNLDIQTACLTIVAGATGCGKSSLVKAILGELRLSKGRVDACNCHVGYCDQTPWLPNGSIRSIIVGPMSSDDVWYKQVTSACALDIDFDLMSNSDHTVVGTNGTAVSHGQQQRIAGSRFYQHCLLVADTLQALARAIYSRSQLIVADDSLSGLDSTTADHVFESVFSKNGLAVANGRSAVLITNTRAYIEISYRIDLQD